MRTRFNEWYDALPEPTRFYVFLFCFGIPYSCVMSWNVLAGLAMALVMLLIRQPWKQPALTGLTPRADHRWGRV